MMNGKKEVSTVLHLRGLYADIIHSFDAYVRRTVEDAVWAAGYSILTKHDNFYTHVNAHSIVFDATRRTLSKLFDGDYLGNVLREIAEKSPQYAEAPEIVYGNGENKIMESEFFLLP
jgi:hypothetical protein